MCAFAHVVAFMFLFRFVSVNVSFSLFPKSVLGMFFVDQDAPGGVASDHK